MGEGCTFREEPHEGGERCLEPRPARTCSNRSHLTAQVQPLTYTKPLKPNRSHRSARLYPALFLCPALLVPALRARAHLERGVVPVGRCALCDARCDLVVEVDVVGGRLQIRNVLV
eukprot:361751-Chlamydomonas_euryale.AAC.3